MRPSWVSSTPKRRIPMRECVRTVRCHDDRFRLSFAVSAENRAMTMIPTKPSRMTGTVPEIHTAIAMGNGGIFQVHSSWWGLAGYTCHASHAPSVIATSALRTPRTMRTTLNVLFMFYPLWGWWEGGGHRSLEKTCVL